MTSFWSLTIVLLLFLINFSQATYDAAAKTNLAVYWGQGAYQQRLLHFCNQSTIDIIPVGFVNFFPAQGNGFPGTNFGNQCSGPPYVYAGPGNDPSRNQLQSDCPDLVADIPVCQSQYGKKIVLSLGGGIDTYGLTGAANGTAFADFLWGAFGPQTKEWLKKGLPRPFDGPNNQSVEVDGFDFDIEFPSSDNQAGYIAMIKRLRHHFGSASKKYLITGAPQCVTPDANMGQMITYAKFDIIFIQYYNTPQCSARNWVTANPNYLSTGIEEPSGFNFDAWEGFLEGTASKGAKLYIGLPAATNTNFYLSPTEVSSLVKAYYCKPNFGGIMLWEATAAENNDVGCGETYYQAMKEVLVDYSQDGSLSCVKAPKHPKPTSSKASCTVTPPTTTSSPVSTITPTPPCTKVYQVVSGDYCYLIWTEFGITEAQLYAWNPFLDTNCDLQPGQVLCVSESPTSTSSSVSVTTTSASVSATPTACTKHYTVVSGDYCYLIETNFGITSAQLYAWNPTLDANCDLAIGQVLCVSESPTSTSSSFSTTSTSASGSATPTACTKHYTVVSGDYCYLIETNFGITSAQLYAWNPTLDANCDLAIGQVLCVSESPTSTSSSSTQVSTTSSASSSPTAACTKHYTVVSGDYCYLIETNFGITSAQLYAWNPTLDSNCDLAIGQVLCVSQTPISSSSTLTSTSSTKSSSSTSQSSTQSSSTSSSSLSSTSSTIAPTSTSPLPTTTPKPVCNSDNCLRQLRGSPAFASTFCASFTAAVNTATMELPTAVAKCQGDVGRISSACSCLGVSTATTFSTSMTAAKR